MDLEPCEIDIYINILFSFPAYFIIIPITFCSPYTKEYTSSETRRTTIIRRSYDRAGQTGAVVGTTVECEYNKHMLQPIM